VSPFRPLHLGTEAQQQQLGPSALTRGPAAPAAELSPAAATCTPVWHPDAVLLPAPCCLVREAPADMGYTWGQTVVKLRRAGVVSHQWLHRWREKWWGENDAGRCTSDATSSPHATWAQPTPVPATCGVRRGRYRRAADVPSSLHTTAPQPGDHSPCMPCLSCGHAVDMPAGVCDVSVWASAWVRVCVHACLCARAHGCACTYRREYPRTSMLSR
jgi:hypothetical protein